MTADQIIAALDKLEYGEMAKAWTSIEMNAYRIESINRYKGIVIWLAPVHDGFNLAP